MNDQEALTGERNNTHGDFADNARVSQTLKTIFRLENNKRLQRNQKPLSLTQMDALDMIAAKIGRIFAGNPDFADHWDDIAGYSHIANRQAGNMEERNVANTKTDASTK